MSTPGVNKGGQLNVYILEVGTIQDLGFGLSLVRTRSIHPLLVIPSSIKWTLNSRTSSRKTIGGAAITAGGLDHARGQMAGTFGVEPLGLGPYIGDGDILFERFVNEVVRMPESMTGDELDRAINDLTGTPFIRLLVADVDPTVDTWYINLYDFWDDQEFQVRISGFTWERNARRGGATGLVHYNMQIDQVGELVTGSLASTILGVLLDGLTLWSDINSVIGSYTLQNIASAFVGLAEIVVQQVVGTVEAIDTWIEDATFEGTLDTLRSQVNDIRALMGGEDSADVSEGTTSAAAAANAGAALDNCEQMARSVGELSDAVATAAPESFDSSGGQVDLAATPDEGFNEGLERMAALATLGDLQDALEFQRVAGKLFGMSPGEYQDFVTAGGSGGRSAPDVRGTIRHTVADSDTEEGISQRYGVAWSRILEVNDLLPDEALVTGQILLIPRITTQTPEGIPGLETFGSHLGDAAYGTDWELGLKGNGAGDDVATVSSEDSLQQGIALLMDTFGDGILATLDRVPAVVRESYLAKRITAILATEPRIAAIESIEVVEDTLTGTFEIDVKVHAINGAVVRTRGVA